MDQSKWWKPKAIAAGFVMLAATGLVCIGKLTGEQWNFAVLAALATFTAASVTENRLLKPPPSVS